ncbi:hypothetical protein [Phaeodactylibacter luteus]|uniref:DUF1887 family protein n=1 Tax=Phaeodactylibacter luteus TaxID=1564516 RepID=A0A5C6RNC9_9BACT|nr:hypothetical protein [Phaeodactylibacter luteus]TXB63733.1 hypothetical protein FRY97_07890 [Phaeodactylibacter luteus]
MATKNKSKSNSADNKRNTNQWQQTIAQEYTYCMISTLNQMVNYLPMLLFDFQQPKMYLTLKGVPNEAFDKCLFDTCKKLKNEEKGTRFDMPSSKEELSDINKIGGIKKPLGDKAKGKKVLWNITGGQRPILLAIFELLKEEERKDDVVMYLEGNNAQLVWMKVEDQKLVPIPASEHKLGKYKLAHNLHLLTIPIALRLMGADVSTYASRKFVPHDALKTIAQKYEKPENELFRMRMLSLNKKFTDKTKALKGLVKYEEVDEKKLYYFEKEYTINGKKQLVRFYNNKIWKVEAKLKSYLLKDGDDSYLSQTEYEFFTQSKNYKERTFPFGHLLEDLFGQKVWEAFGDKVAEMACNVRLYSLEEDVDEQTDEIDIILLTKTGQLVVFEVKSGGMSGDVAKSTKYTTYAIAGVYGKPVLLTALLKAQVSKVGELSKVWPYDTSAKAIRAANRAQLPIIALDGHENNNFKEAIEKLLRP